MSTSSKTATGEGVASETLETFKSFETFETIETVDPENSETLQTFKALDTFETIDTGNGAGTGAALPPETANSSNGVQKPETNESYDELAQNEKNNNGEAPEELVCINIMEEIMRMEAPRVMSTFSMCQCDRCLCDVMAFALNHMPAKYVVSRRGVLFTKAASYGSQYRTDIFSSLTQACNIVKQSPRHKYNL